MWFFYSKLNLYIPASAYVFKGAANIQTLANVRKFQTILWMKTKSLSLDDPQSPVVICLEHLFVRLYNYKILPLGSCGDVRS